MFILIKHCLKQRSFLLACLFAFASSSCSLPLMKVLDPVIVAVKNRLDVREQSCASQGYSGEQLGEFLQKEFKVEIETSDNVIECSEEEERGTAKNDDTNNKVIEPSDKAFREMDYEISKESLSSQEADRKKNK